MCVGEKRRARTCAETFCWNNEVTPRTRYAAVKNTVSKPMPQNAILPTSELCAVHNFS